MKVHISFERPSSFVLELDSVQQAAFEKWEKARDHTDSFDVFDRVIDAAVKAWDEFIDSISYELSSASKAEVYDVRECNHP